MSLVELFFNKAGLFPRSAVYLEDSKDAIQ